MLRVGGCSSERGSDLSMATQPERVDKVESFALEAEVMGEGAGVSQGRCVLFGGMDTGCPEEQRHW